MREFIRNIFESNPEIKFLLRLGLGIIALVIVVMLILLLFNCIDLANTGQIGDTIGGMTSPFLNLIGSILVYLALKEQIVANKISEKENLHQKIILKLNSLEELSLSTKYKPKKLDKKLRLFLHIKSSGNFSEDERIKYIFHLAKIKYVTNHIKAVLKNFNLQETYKFDARQTLEFQSLVYDLKNIYVFHYKIYFDFIVDALKIELNSKQDENTSLLINFILSDISTIEKYLELE